MPRLFSILSLAGAACLLSTPAAAQGPAARMRACDEGESGVPLSGTVTDATTGLPVIGAMILVDDAPADLSDEDGCYSVFTEDEDMAGRRRVRVVDDRYEAGDTVLELSDARADTVHFALQPFAPPCCRLEGEWSIRLTLLDRGGTRVRPRANAVEGRMVFSGRLPTGRDEEEAEQDRELARFDVDLGTFFGRRYVSAASAPDLEPLPSDILFHADGQVVAGDSVMILMMPSLSHGGLLLDGTIRGDTVRGAWVQSESCCGAGGSFVMHRVPPSPEGDALVERGLRAAAELRAAMEKEAAARSARMGRLRLRVWDERAGRHAEVAFMTEAHADTPEGSIDGSGYKSGADGWGDAHEIEPGRYDLVIHEFTCDGEIQVARWVEPGENAHRWTVTIETGRQTDLDLRLDVCAIPHLDFSQFNQVGDASDEQVPVAVP